MAAAPPRALHFGGHFSKCWGICPSVGLGCSHEGHRSRVMCLPQATVLQTPPLPPPQPPHPRLSDPTLSPALSLCVCVPHRYPLPRHMLCYRALPTGDLRVPPPPGAQRRGLGPLHQVGQLKMRKSAPLAGGLGNKSRGRKNIPSAHFPGQTEATATPNSKGGWKI